MKMDDKYGSEAWYKESCSKGRSDGAVETVAMMAGGEEGGRKEGKLVIACNESVGNSRPIKWRGCWMERAIKDD